MTPQVSAGSYSHLAIPTGQLWGEVPWKVLQPDMLTQQPPRYTSTTQWAPHRGSNPGGTSNRRWLQWLLRANPCTSTLLCPNLRDFHQRQPFLPRLLLHSLGQSRTAPGPTPWPTRTTPGTCAKLFPIWLAPSLLLRTLRTKLGVPSLPILLIRHLREKTMYPLFQSLGPWYVHDKIHLLPQETNCCKESKNPFHQFYPPAVFLHFLLLLEKIKWHFKIRAQGQIICQVSTNPNKCKSIVTTFHDTTNF